MGIDLLDVTFRIEKEFHIHVSRDELFGLLRNDDIVVGDLYELVLKKMNLQDVGRHNIRLNEYLWTEMRAALCSATETPLGKVHLSLSLETLFPREIRRARWNALRGVCLYTSRELDYPKTVRLAGIALAAGVVAIELSQVWQIPGVIWLLIPQLHARVRAMAVWPGFKPGVRLNDVAR